MHAGPHVIDQRQWRMLGTAPAFVLAKGGGRLLLPGSTNPPVSMAGTTSLHRLERRSFRYVRSLGLRASWTAARACWPERFRGWLEVSVDRDLRPRPALPPTMEIHWQKFWSFWLHVG